MTIEERIYADLAALAVPVFEQGQWTGDDLPEEFATYYAADSTDIRHFDNVPFMTMHTMQVNIYATDPARLETLRAGASSALLGKGWTRDGRGYAGGLDDKTGLTAWHMVFYFAEKEEV